MSYGIFDLPNEVIEGILKLLQLKDVLACTLTCRLFYKIGSSNHLWLGLVSSYMKKYHPGLDSDSYRKKLIYFSNETDISIRHLLINSYLNKEFIRRKDPKTINNHNNIQLHRPETPIAPLTTRIPIPIPIPMAIPIFQLPNFFFHFDVKVVKPQQEKKRSFLHKNFFKEKPIFYHKKEEKDDFPTLEKSLNHNLTL